MLQSQEDQEIYLNEWKCHYDEILDTYVFTICTQHVFPDIKANFSLLRTLELRFIGPFTSENLRPPLVGQNDVTVSKNTTQGYHTG